MSSKRFCAAAFAAAGLFAGVAQAAPPPLEAYGVAPNVSQVVVSPDGSLLAMATGDTAHRTVVVRKASDKSLVAQVNLGEAVARSLIWEGSGRLMVLTTVVLGPWPSDMPGREQYMVGELNMATGRLAPLHFYGALGSIQAIPVVLPLKGHPAAFVSRISRPIEEPAQTALFRIDLASSQSYRIEDGVKETEKFVVGADGAAVARSDYDLTSGRWSLTVKTHGGWKTAYTETALLDQPAVVGLGPDAASVLVRVHDAQGWVMHQASLKDASWSGPMEATRNGMVVHSYLGRTPAGSLEDALVFDPTTHAVVGFAREDMNRTNYSFFSPEDQKTWDAVLHAFPDQQVTFGSWSEDHKHIVVRVEGAQHGSAWFLLDMAKGAGGWIADEYSGVDADAVIERQVIHYAAADGLDIPAYLTLPKDRPAKGLPLVVLAHGGPIGGPAGRDAPGFDWLAQALASRGYAVLQPQFRGSWGFGEAHLAAGYGEWRRKMQTDLSDGVRALAAKGEIDPSRVCIMGADYGGYAALAGVVFERSVYRCAVDVDGPTDLRKLRDYIADRGGRYYDKAAQRAYDRLLGVQSRWDGAQDALSPALHADQASAPILLIHARNDNVVPFLQSHEMADALARAGKPAELVELKDEDATLSHSATRLQLLTAAVAFLEKQNPPDKPSAQP